MYNIDTAIFCGKQFSQAITPPPTQTTKRFFNKTLWNSSRGHFFSIRILDNDYDDDDNDGTYSYKYNN